MNVGVDLTFIPRFINKEEVAKKVLSTSELNEYYLSSRREVYLASRFALKEAFLKSIKKGILEIELKEIVVEKEKSGAVHIKYKDKNYPASLSHENEYCIGVVVYD